MTFQFSLAPILRLRRSVERQRMSRLREASLKVARTTEQIATIDRYLNASLRADADALMAGRRAVELQFALLPENSLEELRGRLENQLREFELQRQKAADDYQDAYRQREPLDNLRRRQQRIFQQEQLRRQQREQDEAYLLQHGRKP